MIEVKNVSFSYGRNELFKNTSLCFDLGKIYTVVGVNGSGKTTLLNLLARLVKPNGGEIDIDGISYRKLSHKELAKKVSLLPQGRSIPDMKARDLVALGRFPYLDVSRRLTASDEAAVEKAVEAVGISELLSENVRNLSGGERQRVYMAMLAAQDTPYVLLDEPTTYLDIATSMSVMSFLEKKRDDGKCVIAVLHDLAQALKISDVIIVMRDGCILSVSSPEELEESGIIEEVFGVRCERTEAFGEREYFFRAKS